MKRGDVAENEDFEDDVGHKLANTIVRLAAEAVVHAPSDAWVNNIASKCLTLPGKRHGAREGFAAWWASYAMGDANDELPVKAVTRWASFAKAVFDLDESNISRELNQRLLPVLLQVLPVPLRDAPLRAVAARK